MIVYWIAFGGFFFGLTYGLLQVCTEFPILRRERYVGIRIGPYVLSKVAVLAPLLLAMSVIMIVVLRLFDRLREASLGTTPCSRPRSCSTRWPRSPSGC